MAGSLWISKHVSFLPACLYSNLGWEISTNPVSLKKALDSRFSGRRGHDRLGRSSADLYNRPMKTQRILELALERGEITSSEVVKALAESIGSAGEYRRLLAQASTLLSRLHQKGSLSRRWVKENRGQYVYFPSDRTIDSLLPVLNVLQERVKRRQVEEALTTFVRRIVLELRMEDTVKAVLWDPSSCRGTAGSGTARLPVWIVATAMVDKESIETEAGRMREVFDAGLVFVPSDRFRSARLPDSSVILYGWDYVSSHRGKEGRE